MTDLIQTEIADNILTITFNRPEKKNAITRAMYAKMADALASARGDDSVRAIVFTANGDAFTAGNDLIDFQQAPGIEGGQPVMEFLSELVKADKPLVAAVNGIAVGVGLTMLLHCDFVYMAEDAKLQAPFVDLALVPEAASSLLLPARVGHLRAAEIFMLGKKVGAEEAYSSGLATSICEADALIGKATETAQLLARKAPRALQMSKRLMRGDKDILASRMQEESAIFSEQLQSAEVAEAIMAFLEKRPPVFK